MRPQAVNITGVWRALEHALDDRFEIVEPDSLPYGGPTVASMATSR
jgi:hypothetical protein